MGRAEWAWTRFRPWAPWVSLAIGLWNAFGVVRHYEQARWVAWMLAGIWIVFGVLAWLRRRLVRKGGSDRRTSVIIYLFSWAAQSLSQEILFFVLPFWIRSTTWNSHNAFFTVFLLILAASTLYDPLYMEHIAARPRLLLIHKALVAFAGLAFVVPAMMGAHTLQALALAGALSGMAAAFLVPARRRIHSCLLGLFVGAAAAVLGSGWFAPVPMRVEAGTFSKGVQGRLPLEPLSTAPQGVELWAWTPIFAPSGLTDTIIHSWSRDGQKVARVPLLLHGGRKEGFRTWSSSKSAASKAGLVRVDVATSGGQLVGRLKIAVK